MTDRYRYDTGSIIDTKEHKVLTVRQAVNRLNKQDALIESKRDTIQFHVDGYNKIKQNITVVMIWTQRKNRHCMIFR